MVAGFRAGFRAASTVARQSIKSVEGARQLRTTPSRSTLQTSESSPERNFLDSDEALIAKLHQRQLRYRLEGAGSSAEERQEARELAQAEVRWIEEEVRRTGSAPTSASFSRQQRRRLIRMARNMTRHQQPVSYALGHHPFSDLPRELIVRPPSLIPRPETEEWASNVARQVADKLASRNAEPSGSCAGQAMFRILDLCTGSGCIAVLVAHALSRKLGHSGWHVTACDLSAEAVQLARENAALIGIPEDRLSIQQADIFDDAAKRRLLASCTEAPTQPFDLVVCNPPYIPRSEWERLDPSVREWEDPAALIGERGALESNGKEKAGATHDGLDFYHRLDELVRDPSFLRPSSGSSAVLPRLVVEYGKGQHHAVKRIFASDPGQSSQATSTSKAVPPTPRRIVGLERKLMIVGLGNYTHPLTRHSIGQLLLEHLPAKLHERARYQFDRLRQEAERLERHRQHLFENGKVAGQGDQGLLESKISGAILQPAAAQGSAQARPFPPPEATKQDLTSNRDVRGWSCVVPILLDPNPPKGHQRSSSTPQLPYVQLDLVLYKPRYLMNESGKGVLKALQHYGVTTPDAADRYLDLLVLHDELSRDFGKVSRKDRGSAAGHNGVRSCFSSLRIRDIDKETLSRLRIGIGRAEDALPAKSGGLFAGMRKRVDTASWVLGRMDDEQVRSCQNVSAAGAHEEWRLDESKPLPKNLDPLSEGAVLEQTTREILKWAKERAVAALKAEGWQSTNIVTAEEKPEMEKKASRVRAEIKKDLFDVERTLWLY